MVRFVFPKGFEPLSSEPESEILSIELRERGCKDIQFFEINTPSIKNFNIIAKRVVPYALVFINVSLVPPPILQPYPPGTSKTG